MYGEGNLLNSNLNSFIVTTICVNNNENKLPLTQQN